jgi:ornithine cyclodeaminase/alanine dehydrogenase-like protein (mu-crystallin family)
MPELPYLDAATLRAAAPMEELLDAVEAAYRAVSAGRDRSPLRSHVPIGTGDLLLMPGVREDGAGASVKLVTVVPENTGRGLPTVQALVVWFEADTGRPLALLDGSALTAMRTGAASGVATRLLARRDAHVLALFGAGGQAEWQVRAIAAVRSLEEVRVVTRHREGREAFAERMADELALRVEPVGSPEEALDGADLVACATTSATPVFPAGAVAGGTHVNGIGAFRIGMVEIAPELFGRADLVAVDSRQAALAEAGDLVAAIERGILAEDGFVEIGSVDRDLATSRAPSAITIFKSVGLAIQDLAAAELIVRRLGISELPTA